MELTPPPLLVARSAGMSAFATERIPVTVVTGFLGAGKTATVNHLLGRLNEAKTIVIKSEVGDTSVDEALLAGSAWQARSVTEGHTCCGDSSIDRLSQTLVSSTEERGGTDPVLIEMSGLADPSPFLHHLRTQPELGLFTLNAVIAVVDARRFRSAPNHASTRHRQLLAADLVVLNKADCVSPPLLQQMHRQLTTVNPHPPRVETTFGQLGASWTRALRHQPPAPMLPAHLCHADTHAIALEADSDVDPMKLSRWLTSVFIEYGPRLLRIKGDVAMWGQPERFIVNAVGPELDMRPDTRIPTQAMRSRLVVIGASLNAQALQAGFQACLREPWKGDHSCSAHTCC